MTTTNEGPRQGQGVWGVIAQGERRETLAQALVRELETGLGILQKLPAAVTFFGGARIKPDDPYYAAAETIGELLAETGIPPRTGAGPGIMTAVPVGFRRRMQQLAGDDSPVPTDDGARDRNQALTQGFNIKLPFEQSVNPAIDVSLELVHFPTRKLMLWENALGVVFFPGGFGTLDELFETWRLKLAGRLNDPFVLFGSDFWTPLVEALRARAADPRHCSIPPEAFDLLKLTDDPREAIRLLVGEGRGSAFEEPPEQLGKRIAHELVEGLDYLERL
ncbi:MAG: LOG family protein, partial [Myxococcales bacterium]